MRSSTRSGPRSAWRRSRCASPARESFPRSGAPRVAWLGLPEGRPELIAVYQRLRPRLVSLGFEPEKRPYDPHLTIARVKDVPRQEVAAVRGILAETTADAGDCRVDAVTLFRSRLSPRGAQLRAAVASTIGVMGSLSILVGYLAGSVPFAFLLARRAGIDVRVAGSGNVGAANVLRTTGRRRGAAGHGARRRQGRGRGRSSRTLDGAGSGVAALTGAAAVVGHIYPVWLRFHGGKGVAVAAGVFAC